MMPREILIWQAWLRSNQLSYDTYDYNVRVGSGYDPGPGWPQNTRSMWIANTRKRIDVVAWQGSIPTVIEVKDRAGAAAIGQLTTYRPIWLAQFPDLPPANFALVCNRTQPDIPFSCAANNILLWVVPTDFSSLRTDRRASPFMARQRRTNTYTPSSSG
jgi:hypothetical protein